MLYVGPDFIGTVRLQTGPTFGKNLRTFPLACAYISFGIFAGLWYIIY